MKRKYKNKKGRSNQLNIERANMDNKLNYLNLQLEYSFDFGVDFNERTITLTHDVDYPMFDIVNAAMSHMEGSSKAAITIIINSFGGSLYEALAIIGRFKKSKCKIITEGYGAVMSAALLILAAGNKRKLSQFSIPMYHELSYDLYGRHSENKRDVKQAQKEMEIIAEIMSKYSTKDKNYWLKISTTDVYFTPKELLKLGVIDEVI